MDPVQFGMVMLINCALGLNTPPVGTTQFVGCAIGGVSVGYVMRTIWPFYGALIAALMLVTYVPAFSLWLPKVFGYLRRMTMSDAYAPAGAIASTRARCRAAVARPAYDAARVPVGHRPSRPRRVSPRAPGGLHRRRDRCAGDPRWGICGVSLKTPRAIDRARAAGRALLGARARARRRRRRASIGSRARDAVPRRRARRASLARLADPARRDRLPDRHREGLLPRPGDRDAQLRRTRTSRTISRIPRRPVEHDRRAVARARRAARGGRGAAHRRLLRQPSAQRADGRGHRARLRAGAPIRRSREWIGAQRRRFRARWSIASCRRRPTRTSPRPRGCSASPTPRRSSPSRSAQWVIEDRFAGAAPALGRGRRAARRRRRAVRDDEAAPAERQPFDARVPRLSRRARFHLAGVAPIRCSRR